MRSALIVWGGWSGHDPEECAAIYRRWLHEDGYTVRVETDLSVFADPAIRDPNGTVVARDGELLAGPRLQGYTVCGTSDAIYILRV